MNVFDKAVAGDGKLRRAAARAQFTAGAVMVNDIKQRENDTRNDSHHYHAKMMRYLS